MLAIGFATLLLFETLAQIGFKLVAERTSPVAPDAAFLARLVSEPWTAILALAFAATFVTYMTLLRDAPVGPLFAASHLDIVTVALVSVPFFGERLSAIQLVGCVAICVGVVILATAEGRRGESQGGG
ncbi:DMT family transporter [Terrarubrum flagellatum]|uniref:DMT family transporter n=1 Tax=Terrirubrum flagellatum TaxID=2895980 RepID=UPI0031450DBF